MGEWALPNRFKIVDALTPVSSNGAKTANNVSLRDVQKAWIVCSYSQGTGHATTVQPVVGATDAACTTAITFSTRWWRNATTATTDTLTAQTAATSCACSSAGTPQLLVIEIDPADVCAQDPTYDWLGFTQASSGAAGNYTSAVYMLEMRYQQTTPPAVIT